MKNILRVVILVFILAGFINLQAQPGCPEVTTATNVNIPCGQTCTTLTASAFAGAATTSYTVASIPYAPPFAFNSGTPVLVHTDDLWSTKITLPFNFCFFGNSFSSAIIGSNGCISFDVANAGLFNDWSIPAGGAPFTGEADMRNSIMAPWQDLDPTNKGDIYYNVGGAAPCRYLEVSWYQCPMYGDPNSVNTAFCTIATSQTQMAVIYETSMAVEIYIENKAVICNNRGNTDGGTYPSGYWNNGWAIEGIMNGTGTVAYTVPGRNATQWTATNDAYRFTPAGAPNYTIAWFNAAGTQIGTGGSIQVCPPPGSTQYIAKATYTNCDNSTVTVSANVFVGLSNLTVTDSAHAITCYDANNGAVFANYNTTTGLLSYGWAPGGSGQTTLSNLGPGTYIFTAEDSIGCTVHDTETLVNPAKINLSLANDTVPSCTGNTSNGTLTVTASGGVPGYIYKWSGGQTTATISGLGVGADSVRVTDSQGCKDTAYAIVAVKAHTVSLGAGQITNATCFGGTNGKIIAGGLTGGVSPVTYNWSVGTGHTDSLTNIGQGTYTVTAIDADSCSVTATYTVGQATAVVVTVPNDTVVSCSASTNNGVLTASASGGTPSYTYSWTGGTTVNPLTGLGVGTYSVTVTDSHSCTGTGSGSVVVSTHPLSLGTPQITNASCFGGNGQIIANLNGGTTPITYSWSVGTSVTDTFTGPAGSYTVTATDHNGCSASATYSISSPSAVNVSVANDTVLSCDLSTTHGSLTASASGGTPGYTYSWTSGTTNPITGLGFGCYTVTVSDSHSCTATATGCVAVTTHPITFNAPQITNVSCQGGTNGQIIVSVTGGANPITYSWSVGNSHSDTLSNVGAGNYSVTATSADGCTASASFTVSQPLTGITVTVANDTVTSCSGDSTIGTLTALATGGTPSYTYSWSNTLTTNPIVNLVHGNYTVTVHDVFGCSATASGTVVTNISQLGITARVSNPVCFGLKGEIIVTVTGATPPITYSWNPGNSHTDTLTGVGGGIYNVTATDANGCSISASYNVNQPIALLVTVPNDTVISCSGTTTSGMLTASGTGGTPGYTYSWTNNATSNPVTGLNSGQYCVTITDNVGCTASTCASVDIIANPITFNTPQITNVKCSGGSTGQIILGITGGTAPVTFSWSGGTTQNDTLRNLPAGTYNITATDVNGCSATASYTINAASPIVFGAPTITNVGCSGGNTGAITVTATGGTGTITYSWANGTGATITGLAAGGYIVTATDANGCTATAEYTIGQSAPIAIGVPTVQGTSCTTNDGSISVTATGGTGTLTYSWNPGHLSGTPITGLGAGGYTLTVTDANGCSATAYYIVGHTDCGCPEVIPASNNVVIPCSQTCTNLSATVFSAAQTTAYTEAAIPYNPPFSFTGGTVVINHTDDLWSDTINLPFTFCFWGFPHNKIIVGSNGEISFNIQNANSFNNWSIPGPIPFGNTEPDQKNTIMAPWQDLDPTNFGTIYYNITGTAPCRKFEVSWDNCPMFGDSLSVDNSYCSHQDHQTQMVVLYETTNAIDIYIQNKEVICTDLSGGTYWNNGWAIEGIVGPNNTAGDVLAVPGRNATRWTAQNDAVRFTPSGAANYTVAWYQGSNLIGTTDTVTVCPSVPTTYTVQATYTDCNNNQIVVGDSVYVTPGGSLTVSIDSVHNILCNGDSNGAVYASYHDTGTVTSFGWSPGGANQTSLVGIPAGTYIFSVTTSTGCTKSDTVVLVNPSKVVATVANDTFNSCSVNNLGTLHVGASGGTPGYTYLWSNGSTTDTISGLTPGTYRVTVTDSHGCTGSATGTVVQITGNIAFTTPQVKNATCSAGGSIIIGVTGGTAPVTYSWSPTEPNTDTLNGLSAGTYTVTATDAGGCSVSASFVITAPPPVVIGSPVIKNVTCNGAANGSIIVRASGGNLPFTYSWSPSASNTDTLSGLSPGTYCVTVTDSSGCSASACYTITQPSPIANQYVSIDSFTCTVGGSVSIIDTGGVAPLTYSWTNGQTTDSIGNLQAGTVSVTVTDAHGCSITASYTVPTAAGVLAFGPAVIVNTSCHSDSTGSITVTTTGGDSVTYVWSNHDSTATITGLGAGTYTVTATDTSGCSVSASYTIIQPVAIIFGNAIIDSATCNGASTGEIIVTTTGGSGVVTYSWSNNDVGDTITGLAANVYCVTATDTVGCSASICYNVAQPAPITITPVITPITCLASGKVVVAPSGGNLPYTYSWTTGSTGDSTLVSSSGTVTVTVTDAHGCSATASYTLNVGLGSVTIDSARITNVTCNGNSNGSIIVFANDSLGGPITYSWTTHSTSDTVTGLSVGSYTVTVTDSTGCSASATYNITQPNAITFGPAVIVPPVCHGDSDGSITVVATGGTGTITYAWAGPVAGATDTALAAGTYTVTATDSLGCSATMSYTITAPQPITLNNSVVDSITCNGAANGSINAIASGGNGGYTYSWGNGATTALITGLGPNTYCVTVTDSLGCSGSMCFTLSQPPALVIDSDHIQEATCTVGGSVIVFVSGGTGAITYSWSSSPSVIDSAGGLAGGSVTVTVTDHNGCSISATYVVPAAPNTVTIDSAHIVNVACNGSSTGSITVFANGGTGSLHYTWNPNEGTTSAITGLAAGTYAVTVTDSLGCSASAQYNVTQPNPLVIADTLVNAASCTVGGNVVITATGGTTPYTYSWSPNTSTSDSIGGLSGGQNVTVTVTDSNSCSVTASYVIPILPNSVVIDSAIIHNISCNGLENGSITVIASGGHGTLTYSWGGSADVTDSMTNLGVGTYTITVTDSLGCTASATYSITQPQILVIDSGHITAVTCAKGGSVVLTVTGGTAPYSYSWSPNTSSVDSITNLTGGTVNVTVTDHNGCSTSATYNVPVIPNTVLIDSDHIVNDVCHGGNIGSITVYASGGNGTLTYSWTPSEPASSNITGLAAGNYTVTVTDSLGCTATATYTITQPSAIIIDSLVTTQVTCVNQGSVDVYVSGGTPGYTYTWSPGNAHTDSVGGLNAGTYDVTIMDANGCSITSSGTVTTAPNSIAIAFDSVQPTCFGLSNGSITAVVTGGTPGYTYSWSTGSTALSITGLASATYCLTVHDAAGCSSIACDSLPQPSLLVITHFTNINASCNALGSQLVVPSGGTAPYTYLWSDGETTDPNINVSGGSIDTVVVTDHNGCHVAGIDTMAPAPAPLVITPTTLTNNSCYAGSAGVIAITVTGGLGGYTYSWSPGGQTTSTITGLIAGTYSVTVDGTGGCDKSDTFTITQPQQEIATVTASPMVCPGACDTASVTVNPEGEYTYSWSSGGSTQLVSVCNLTTTPTIETVTVTDASNCTITASESISAAPQITDTAEVIPHPCAGGGSVDVVATGGTGALTYDYTPGGALSSSGNFGNLPSGSYTYLIFDTLGCNVSGSFIVPPSAPADVDSIFADSTSCFGFSDGSITVIEDSLQNAPFTYSINGGPFGNSNVFDSLAVGSYQVIVHNSHGCADTLSATVGQPAQITVTFSPDTIQGIANYANLLTPIVSNAINPVYLWSPTTGLSCATCGTDSATITAPQWYYLTVSDSANPQCKATDSVLILLKGPLVMPNAFSPNGSNPEDDFFGPVSHTYVIVKEFHIYNRWGQLVHNSTDPWDGKFDGKPQPTGTYIYYIVGEYEDPNNPGNYITGKAEGAVTLLR